MKANIHPTWYKDAKVTCVCGNTFTTGSTVPVIKVELCSNCHPFYTGQQKLVDTQGQVQKFQSKIAVATAKKQIREQIIQNRASKIQKEKTDKPSLKELLLQARKSSSPSK